MNLTRRDFLKALGISSVTAAAALALAACGEKTEGGSTAGGTGTTTPSTGSNTPGTATPAGQSTGAVEGENTEKEITIGTGLIWDTPTPWRANTGNDAYVGKLVFEALGIQDYDMSYVPWAAKSWKTDDNGWTYDIELYDYIHDQEGNPITADDLVWFIETSKQKALKPNWRNIDTVTKTGDYTIQVKLTSNQVGVFDNLVFDTFIVSQKAVEASGDDFATSLVSTNAYKMTAFTSQVEMAFERDDNYWQTDVTKIPRQAEPHVKKMNLKNYTEASQLGNALEAGDIDFALSLAPSTAMQFEGDDAYNVEVYSKPNGYQVFFTGAENRPCGTDENLRKAIAYCIDTNLIIASAMQGYAGPMYDTANDKAYGYLDKWKTEEYYPYDVEKAKEYLAKSNYKGETLVILAGGSFKPIAEILISNMDAIGVKAELLTGDMAWITANRLDGTLYDMFINQVGCVSLAAQWSIRFDPKGYSTGDGTSRHDYELGEMLYKTWTFEGYTPENIDAVHTYIKDHMYAYGLVDNYALNVWSNKVGLLEVVQDCNGSVRPEACVYA